AEDGIRDATVTGVQTCALPIYEKRQPLDLVNQVASAKLGFPLSLWSYDEGLRKQLREALYLASSSESHITVPASPGVHVQIGFRSEERRVGRECRCWVSSQQS